MEPSSGQNSTRNNESQDQTLPEEETQGNDPVAPEGTPEDNSSVPTEGVESTVPPTVVQNVPNLGAVSHEFTEPIGFPRQHLPVVLTFAARGRPRQPFFADTSTPASTPTPASTSTGRQTGRQQPIGRDIPPPPSYYPSRRVQIQQPVQEQPQPTRRNEPPQREPEREQSRQKNEKASRRLEHQYEDTVSPLLNPMVNPFTNIVAWAPYPPKLDPEIPTYLAHLVAAEVVFVVQHLEAIEIFGSLEFPNVYFIQNDKGESIYYVYESTVCIPCCCQNSRALQLHVMDMYQNEVIFMRKSCGCALYFCCFPFLEVYSPPSVPIGAIVKKFHPCREQFHILDADENLIFKIYGDCSLTYCSRCIHYDFTIRALDQNETEVGFIRRDFPGMYQFLMGTEYYGVSFPLNMDVRMKAVFLGALFLIDFLYFE